MHNYYYNHEGYPDPTAYKAIRNVDKRPYRPLVYICSPYSGDVKRNITNARRYCRFAVKSGFIPLAPHLLYPQFMDDTDEEEHKLGLFFGSILMDKCQEVWVFGDYISNGMNAEINRARRKGYEIKRFSSSCSEIVQKQPQNRLMLSEKQRCIHDGGIISNQK